MRRTTLGVMDTTPSRWPPLRSSYEAAQIPPTREKSGLKLLSQE